MILVGDVGATKTALAVVPDGADPRSYEAVERFGTAQWEDLVPLVRAYLDKHRLRIDEAAFGVPGPVVAGYARCTNVPWEITGERLQDELHVRRVMVVNDVEAAAAAIPSLQSDEVASLRDGERIERGTLGLVAPGTGLGEAFVTWDGERYRAHPSEGGHADFAALDALQWELLGYLQMRHGHVSYERVCSGTAVPDLYAFLRDSGREPEPPGLTERLRDAADRTAAIFAEGVREDGASICRRTVQLFVEILGAEVGNFALSIFASGGMYLGGGIPRRIVPMLRSQRFMNAVRSKGRLSASPLLQRLPIHVITRPGLALVGLAHYAGSHVGD